MKNPDTLPKEPAAQPVLPGRRVRDLVPAVSGAVLAIVAFVLAAQIPEGARLTQFAPRWWPETLAVLLLLLSLALAALALLRKPAEAADQDVPEPATRQGVLRLVSMVGSIVGYGVLWYFVDFRVSTLVLFVALTWLGGGRGWKALVLFPVITTAILYLLFGVLLRVPL